MPIRKAPSGLFNIKKLELDMKISFNSLGTVTVFFSYSFECLFIFQINLFLLGPTLFSFTYRDSVLVAA